MLNILEYAWIYLNVPDVVTYHKVAIQITEQLSRQAYSGHCQIFKMSVMQKE